MENNLVTNDVLAKSLRYATKRLKHSYISSSIAKNANKIRQLLEDYDAPHREMIEVRLKDLANEMRYYNPYLGYDCSVIHSDTDGESSGRLLLPSERTLVKMVVIELETYIGLCKKT